MLRKTIPYAIVCMVLDGCAGLDPTQTANFDQRVAAIAESRWVDARGAFDKLLEGRPDHAPARLLRAEACMHLGEVEIALSDLEKALHSSALPDPRTGYAHFLRGRCLVQKGQRLVDDTAFRTHAVDPDLGRRAREHFMSANVAFRRASEIAPAHYDSLLWRAYSLYRQENYRRALQILKTCDTLLPDDWRQRFFRVLAREGAQGLDTRSVEQVLEIASDLPSDETFPVINYLIDIHDEVPESAARRIEQVVETFRRETGVRSTRLTAFLGRVEEEHATRERSTVVAHTIEQARKLAIEGRYEDSIGILVRFRKRRGEHPDVRKLHDQLSERWSRLLETSAAPLVDDGSPARLQEALKIYHSARDLTENADRAGAMLKKVAMVENLLHQHHVGEQLDEAARLREQGRHVQALALVDRLSLDRLDKINRNLLHFERGGALYHLERWNDASASFARISPDASRDFEPLTLLHGMSLVRSNRLEAGVALLKTTPTDQRDDTMNRLIASQLFGSGRLAEALTFLADVSEPGPDDTRLEANSRKHLGIELFGKHEYSKAAEHLTRSANLFRSVLDETSPETLALLGKAQHRRGQLDLARTAFEEFAQARPPRTAQVRFRDVYLSLGRLRLKDEDRRGAYEALKLYVSLGGTLPSDLSTTQARLVATFADYLPLDRVVYWRYERDFPAGKEPFDVFVREDADGRYNIEVREDELTLEEEWWLEEDVLVRRSRRAEFRLPTRLREGSDELPTIEYDGGGQNCVARIVSYDDSVDIASKRSFRNCLRIETTRDLPIGDGETRRIRQLVWLAPGEGEVRRQIFDADTLVTTIELQEVKFRTRK